MDNKYKIILASNSPRRKELLAGLDIAFEVVVKEGIDETYPENLLSDEVPLYLSRLKAAAYRDTMTANELVLTADTVVVVDDMILGKPSNEAEAYRMLRLLSGRTHHVVTGVSLTTLEKQRSFNVTTEVTFRALSDAEINYYVERYKPFDKAGAYGIQGKGRVLVEKINGDYFSIMGFPISNFLENLRKIGYKISQIDKI